MFARIVFGLAASVMCGIASASPVVLAQYDIGGSLSDSSFPYPADLTAGSVSAGDLTVGPDLFTYSNSNPGYFSASEWPASFDKSDAYISFSLTPDAGKQIEYSSLNFVWAQGSPVAPPQFVVRSSADDYTADLFTATYDPSGPATHTVDVDLSGLAPQSGTVTFRLYGYGTVGQDSGGLAGLQGSDQNGGPLIVSGTVSPAPEPATLGLLGVGAIGLLMRRRRK
jgi:hypothetical protein